jgi:hypothetical protein
VSAAAEKATALPLTNGRPRTSTKARSVRGLFETDGIGVINANLKDGQIDQTLNQEGYIILKPRGLRELCHAARKEYDSVFKSSPLHATRQRFHYSQLKAAPWRKLAIGSTTGLGETYAQNLQSLYFACPSKDVPALNTLFRYMIGIRNQLMGVAPAFGSNAERDRFWNACRVHHYPRGGGFMSMHRDTHFPQIIADQIGKPFYQICVLLSRKGEDFMQGGGVIVTPSGHKVDLEVEAGFGALVIFDGRTWHGVEDVDLDEIVDFQRPDGRLAAFVNLYSTPPQPA